MLRKFNWGIGLNITIIKSVSVASLFLKLTSLWFDVLCIFWSRKRSISSGKNKLGPCNGIVKISWVHKIHIGLRGILKWGSISLGNGFNWFMILIHICIWFNTYGQSIWPRTARAPLSWGSMNYIQEIPPHCWIKSMHLHIFCSTKIFFSNNWPSYLDLNVQFLFNCWLYVCLRQHVQFPSKFKQKFSPNSKPLPQNTKISCEEASQIAHLSLTMDSYTHMKYYKESNIKTNKFVERQQQFLHTANWVTFWSSVPSLKGPMSSKLLYLWKFVKKCLCKS